MRLFRQLWRWLKPEPTRLAVVRRYLDANGWFVGELYLFDTMSPKKGISGCYNMIGASLDSLPLEHTGDKDGGFSLDIANDFLAPMPLNTLRVGGITPSEDIAVRAKAKAWKRVELKVENRFIEHVLDARENT